MGTWLRKDWKPGHSIAFAHTACFCLGAGMIVRGLAPPFVERLVAGHAPAFDSLLPGSLLLMLGVSFIGMHVLVRRCVVWAVWAAFALCTLLVGSGLALIAFTGIRPTSSFLLLLSGVTCLATWLAIGTLSRAETKASLEPHSLPRRAG